MDQARGAVTGGATDDERGADAQAPAAATEQPKKRGRKERRAQKREARQALIARDRATPARQLVADETLDGLEEAACPALFGGTSSSSPEAKAQQQAARSGRFQVLEGQQTRLVVPVNWHMDPFESVKFQGKLQNMSWLDPLFRAYQRGDVGALRQARGLVLDWIRNNRRRGGGLPKKAWGDKVSGDRAPRIAYLTRAATCEEILDRVESRQLLASVERPCALPLRSNQPRTQQPRPLRRYRSDAARAPAPVHAELLSLAPARPRTLRPHAPAADHRNRRALARALGELPAGGTRFAPGFPGARTAEKASSGSFSSA